MSSESSGFSSESRSPSRRRSFSRSRSPRRDVRRGRSRSRSHNGSISNSPVRSRRNGRGRSSSFSSSGSRSRGYNRERHSHRRHPVSRSPSRSRSPAREHSQSSPTIPRHIIKVIGLSRNVTKEHIYEIFSQSATIVDCVFPVHEMHGCCRGYAFVEFGTKEESERAIKFMNGGQLDGNLVECTLSNWKSFEREKQPRPSQSSTRGPLRAVASTFERRRFNYDDRSYDGHPRRNSRDSETYYRHR